MKLCNTGPKNELNDLRYSHVAIFTASLGYLEKLKEERPEAVFNCVGTAGFSVGEIASLVFAGSLKFDQGKDESFGLVTNNSTNCSNICSSAAGSIEGRSDPYGW